MRKAQIHFSNSLEALIEVLKNQLFIEGSRPFDRRLVIVPHLQLKSFIMESLVKDEEIQVAAGMHIVSLHQAIEKLTGKIVPHSLILSLFVEHELPEMIAENQELKEYFNPSTYEQRIGPFCDYLSHLFSEYSLHKHIELLPWQEKLWQKIKQNWLWPSELSKLTCQVSEHIHLFGFSFLPTCYLDFFHTHQAQFYFFSPCQIFWGDYLSEKKQFFMGQQFSAHVQEDFYRSFEKQNYLLAQWGLLGQKQLLEIEEKNFITEEYYLDSAADTALHCLQSDLLHGISSLLAFDHTVHFFSAPSKQRELEVLKEMLMKQMIAGTITPSDVLVFAPDINDYVPYIHAVFGQLDPVIPYSITGLTMRTEDPYAHALGCLLDLSKKRCSVEAVCSFLQLPLVMKKLNISQEDFHCLKRWLECAYVEWGISLEQRKKLRLREMPGMEATDVSPMGTWEHAFTRLILGFGQNEEERFPLCIVSSTEIDILNKFFLIIHKLEQDLNTLIDEIRQTIPEWIQTVLALLHQYLPLDFSHDINQDLLRFFQETKDLQRQKVSWSSFERVIDQILAKKNCLYLAPHLQAIHFSSLSLGCSSPSKVIHILGLQENAFPKSEKIKELSSSSVGHQKHKDRYLLLEILFNARTSISFSFETSQQQEPSLLLTQLLSQGKNGYINAHNILSFPDKEERIDSLIPEFYVPTPLTLPKATKSLTIEFRMLAKFARNPLRFYFHEILKIFPSYTEQEFLLSPFIKQKLIRKALGKPVEEVLQKAEYEGTLPKNAFQDIARGQIVDEVEIWQACLKQFGISPEEINSIELHPFCKHPKRHPEGTWIYPAPIIKLDGYEICLVGQIDDWTPQGLLINEEESVESLIKFWPHHLLLQHLGLKSLLFIKDQKPFTLSLTKEAMENYLRYFLLAFSYASPLLPEFGQALLKGTVDDLHKALKEKIQRPDEIFTWLKHREALAFQADVIYENWSPLLRTIFDSKSVEHF